MNKIRVLFFFLPGFFLISCSYHEGVYFKNNTKKNIIVKVTFETKMGDDVLNFSLKPDGYDSWEYEAEFFDREMIDKNLKKVLIKINNGCHKNYSRDEISKIAVKRGMWEIHIDDSLINCEQ